MKRCPQCRQVFLDEMIYCLSDGSPLGPSFDEPEEATVLRPAAGARVSSSNTSSRIIPIFLYLAAAFLLLLLLIGGAFTAWLFLWNPVNKTSGNTANAGETVRPSPTPAVTISNAVNSASVETPSATPRETPRPGPSPETIIDPALTRINFQRGRVSETMSGRIGKRRGYVLRASSGQYLSASVRSANDCVTFNNGSSTSNFTTQSGDNYLYITNNCGAAAQFDLSVTVR